jgi:dihydrodipicolinate reductase
MDKSVAIIGASGAIGSAFVEYYSNDQSVKNVFAFSRKKQSYENKKVQSFDLILKIKTAFKMQQKKLKKTA